MLISQACPAMLCISLVVNITSENPLIKSTGVKDTFLGGHFETAQAHAGRKLLNLKRGFNISSVAACTCMHDSGLLTAVYLHCIYTHTHCHIRTYTPHLSGKVLYKQSKGWKYSWLAVLGLLKLSTPVGRVGITRVALIAHVTIAHIHYAMQKEEKKTLQPSPSANKWNLSCMLSRHARPEAHNDVSLTQPVIKFTTSWMQLAPTLTPNDLGMIFNHYVYLDMHAVSELVYRLS